MSSKPKEDVTLKFDHKETEPIVKDVKVGVTTEEPITTETKIGKVVCKNRLNIRKNPSLSAEIIGTLSNGQKVEVFLNEAPIDKDWLFVAGETGIEGYCMTRYLTIE